LVGVGEVTSPGVEIVSPAELGRKFLERLSPATDECNAESIPNECVRGGAPDPGCRARDDGAGRVGGHGR
jgi:hypothetical protein